VGPNPQPNLFYPSLLELRLSSIHFVQVKSPTAIKVWGFWKSSIEREKELGIKEYMKNHQLYKKLKSE
jgi:hypothetical protein